MSVKIHVSYSSGGIMQKAEFIMAIKQKYDDNTNYNIPIHAANQAEALTALSVDLYTDANRFIYELLQNADDSSCKADGVKVWIKVFNDELVVAHSGKVFDVQDIRGICNINNGTKKSDLKKTGYKGIGFKSVFGQSNNVVIYTDGEFFRFDSSYNFEWIWAGTQKEWENENNRTFQYPWQIIPIYTESTQVGEKIRNYISEIDASVATILKIKHIKETMDAIHDLSQNINMFLFLKNITEISFEDRVITIDRSNTNKILLNKGRTSQKEWLIKNVNLNVSEELRNVLLEERHIPQKLLEAKNIEMIFAAQIDKNGIAVLEKKDRVLYSYLPTEVTEYAIPVLVNTSFLISANRESIHKDSKWNQWIFECISYEIFKWISELVISEISFDAYKLIPEETSYSDGLANSYNFGIKKAKEDIAFILSRENTMIKISDALIDFTYLSEKNFIGEESIKNFISKQNSNAKTKFYVKQCAFWIKLKNLGISSFEWKDFNTFLMSNYFLNEHSVQRNIELLKHLKSLSENERVKEVTSEFISKLHFIISHKGNMCFPEQICFPNEDDENWDNPNSDLLFIHKDILSWVLTKWEVKNWLQGLGIKERTDITYITQNILPNIDTYINKDNAISEIQKLFLLYKKGDLKESLIKELSEIKLLTKNGTLLQAKKCYLSDFFNPRLRIEQLLEEDIFVSEKYSEYSSEKDEWKRFLKFLGVSEGIRLINFSNKTSKQLLINQGFEEQYFSSSDKVFSPYINSFRADEFSNVNTLMLLEFTLNNHKFANSFWCDYIENFTPAELISGATAYWGNYGMPGRTHGDLVANYLPWFVMNVKCIPTVMKETEQSKSVFLNSDEIKSIAGNYLPVFSGSDLSQNWKAFFNFKTTLQIDDYLEILNRISEDVNHKAQIKNENYKRVQSIYSILLENCENWSVDESERINEWASTHLLLDTKDCFTKSYCLKYYIDGNDSVFQEQYSFIKFDAKNKNHPSLKKLLKCFGVDILHQDLFKLESVDKQVCVNLKDRLNTIIPYFKIWIEFEDNDDSTKQRLVLVQEKVNLLKIFQSSELKIAYPEIEFSKSVNLHFENEKLYVASPWNSNRVLINLPELLCRHFELEGHASKLDFLLRADIDEIQQYFIQESIEFPAEWTVTNQQTRENNILPASNDYYESSEPDFDKKNYIENLIPRAVENVINHLSNLSEYDCSAANVMTGKSVIGGIKKNGYEIAVVARPSDNEKIRLFYDSEFDTLEYADAELWYEDGKTPPRQFTFGQLLKMQGTNKIPLKKVKFKDIQASNPKSVILEFNSVPYSPEKTAQTIAAFANTKGGTILFGIKELSSLENEIVGLSKDFNMIDITNKAISMLNPTPDVSFDWIAKGEELIFVIEIEKANEDILLNSQKYIRDSNITKIENFNSTIMHTINNPKIEKTIAIIIAIENYAVRSDNQVDNVKFAIRDASRFKEMLISSMGVAQENIFEWKNEEALKSNLDYELKSLFYSLTENDRLIFYYVGHGFHDGVTNYLSTYDIHPFNIAETAISMRKILLDPLQQSKCKNAFIFIDACAKSFDNVNERSHITNINEEEFRIISSKFESYSIFLSCNPGQSSYSCDELKNGIWTYFLTTALTEPVDEIILNHQYVTDRKIGDYLSHKVAQYAKSKYNWNQNPKVILDSCYENVITEIKA